MIRRLQGHGPIAGVLAISWLLRAVLALRGGQFYWPDEWRYLMGWKLANFISSGRGGLASVMGSGENTLFAVGGEHPLFALVAYPPACLQFALFRVFGVETAASLWIAALYFTLASTACIALTYAIALRAGSGRGEALAAAGLMACSASMFYYARHLLPYDTALAFALLALWLGLKESPTAAWSALCGFIASLAFMTYNGYWPLVLAVLAIHAVWRSASRTRAARRALAAGLGLAVLPLIFQLVSAAQAQRSLFATLFAFSAADMQGATAEGYRLPWAYFWHAEHGLLLLWAAGAAAALRPGPGERPERGRLWLGAAAGIYLLLVLGSNGLGRFAVHARHARQVTVFVCLAAACGLSRLRWDSRTLKACGLAALLVQTGSNFARPLSQRFPNDFTREVVADHGPVAVDTTVTISSNKPRDPSARLVLLNVQHLFPLGPAKPAPAGEVLLRAAHPLEYLPYQYEGFTADERAVLRAADISMRLLEVRPPGAALLSFKVSPGTARRFDASAPGQKPYRRIGFPLIALLSDVYALSSYRIDAGKRAMRRFDLEADFPGSLRDARPALQSALLSGLGLKARRETRSRPVFVLSRGPGPLGLPAAAPSEPPEAWRGPLDASGEMTSLNAKAQTLASLAGTLEEFLLDKPVVDETGVAGTYDFDLRFRSKHAGELEAALGRAGLRLAIATRPVEMLILE
ncbi:MAG: TIGR03435 family protein [Elusimicrobia bacterium]|nr:TIGR03435 family protein [Elusimicrobiota bacterium]